MQTDTLTPNQRRTLAARKALRDKFATEEERSQHYRDIGARGNAGRLTLSGDEARALAEAYAVLRRVARRFETQEEAAEGKSAAGTEASCASSNLRD